MTVKQLRDALNLLAERHDNDEVLVWLPGNRVHLVQFMGSTNEGVLIEGNRYDLRRT